LDQQWKRDEGKPRLDLLPTPALAKTADVFEYGTHKYEPWSWRKHPAEPNRWYASTMRHLFAWVEGEETDPESGLPHLAHATADLLIMLQIKEDRDYREETSSTLKPKLSS